MHVWNELTQCAGKKAGYEKMVGAQINEEVTGSGNIPATTLYIPLEFWFKNDRTLKVVSLI
jgi:hypothetical protein